MLMEAHKIKSKEAFLMINDSHKKKIMPYQHHFNCSQRKLYVFQEKHLNSNKMYHEETELIKYKLEERSLCSIYSQNMKFEKISLGVY